MSDSTNIYTDGSKCEHLKAAYFYVPDLKLGCKIKLPDNSSVYESELVAIMEVLCWVEARGSIYARILSDSLSALQALADTDTNSALLCDIRYLVYQIRNAGGNVQFSWIPSHVGIRGNEKADKLAKESLLLEPSNIQLKHECSSTYKDIRDIFIKQWQDRWSSETKGCFYAKLVPEVSLKTKFSNKYRQKEKAITRLRFGHSLLNGSLKRLGKHPDGLCNTCGVEETVENFVMDCIDYQHLQFTLVNKLLGNGDTVNITNVLTKEYMFDSVWPFVTESGRLL